MIKKTMLAAAVAAMTVGILAAPAPASAGVKQLAKQECRGERADDPAEFTARYGSGKKAIKRCAKAERREARADCRGDRAEEPAEFAAEYGGTGRSAMKRCVRDELT